MSDSGSSEHDSQTPLLKRKRSTESLDEGSRTRVPPGEPTLTFGVEPRSDPAASKHSDGDWDALSSHISADTRCPQEAIKIFLTDTDSLSGVISDEANKTGLLTYLETNLGWKMKGIRGDETKYRSKCSELGIDPSTFEERTEAGFDTLAALGLEDEMNAIAAQVESKSGTTVIDFVLAGLSEGDEKQDDEEAEVHAKGCASS